MTLKEENNTEETPQELAHDSSTTIVRRIYILSCDLSPWLFSHLDAAKVRIHEAILLISASAHAV